MAFIETHAVPRMDYYRSNQSKELPEDGMALLKEYIDVAPYLVPSPTNESESANVLWHPDLHLDNIFVDPNTYQITRIVDWQSACVAPLFYQSSVPRLCRSNGPVRDGWVVPKRPDDFEGLSERDRNRSTRIWRMRSSTNTTRLRCASAHAGTGQSSNSTQSLYSEHRYGLQPERESLMELVAHWEELFPGVTCPITFSREEVELQAKEEENINGVGHLLTLFRDQAVLPVDGMVDPKDFDVAHENCRKFKDIFVGLGKDDGEKELFRNLWPYQSLV